MTRIVDNLKIIIINIVALMTKYFFHSNSLYFVFSDVFQN